MGTDTLIQIVGVADVIMIVGVVANLGVMIWVVCAGIARRRSGLVWRRK